MSATTRGNQLNILKGILTIPKKKTLKSQKFRIIQKEKKNPCFLSQFHKNILKKKKILTIKIKGNHPKRSRRRKGEEKRKG